MKTNQLITRDNINVIMAFNEKFSNKDNQKDEHPLKKDKRPEKLPNDIIPEADKINLPENQNEEKPEIQKDDNPAGPKDMDLPADRKGMFEKEITNYPTPEDQKTDRDENFERRISKAEINRKRGYDQE